MAASMSNARREFIEIYVRGRLRDTQACKNNTLSAKNRYIFQYPELSILSILSWQVLFTPGIAPFYLFIS